MAQSNNLTTLASARPRPPATIGELLSREDETRDALKKVATKYLPADRALRLAITAVRQTPRLAQCSPTSFMGALIAATGLGLEPNTPKQHAFLIPYKSRRPKRNANGVIEKDSQGSWLWEEYYECQFQVGYKGFVTLFYRTSIVKSVQAEAVYLGDKFEHRIGTETFLAFQKNLAVKREVLQGAFCYTGLVDGQAFTVLGLEDVYKIRSRSQTYRTLVSNVEKAEAEAAASPSQKTSRDLAKAAATLAETPWVFWEDQMAAKSAIKRHAKQQDLGAEVAAAADIDSGGDMGTIDIDAMADPELAREVIGADGGGSTMSIPERTSGTESVDPETGEIVETATEQNSGQDQSSTQTRKEPPATSPNTTSTDPARDTSQTKPATRPRPSAAGMFSE
jgi:phage RecT family recombinase